MDKKTKNEKSKSKKKKGVKSFKNNNLKKEKTSSKFTDAPKAENSNQTKKLNQNKSKNKDQKINNIASKKYSIDNRETNSNSNNTNNNITDSSEIFLDKKKPTKAEISNKKLNIKSKKNKGSEDNSEKNENNKEYNINPFIINNKLNNQKKVNFSNNNKEINNINNNINNNIKINEIKDMNENNINNNNIINKPDISISSIIDKNVNENNEKRNIKDRNKDINNIMEFSFEKKLLNTIEPKEKKKIYKNRFLAKINKNKNNSKERKSEGSFGSLIHQKKLKLFTFSNEQNNSINIKETTIVSISSKNIKIEAGKKENKLIKSVKEDLIKLPQEKNQQSAKKHKIIDKKLSHRKIKGQNYNTNRINNNNINNINIESYLDDNNESKENKGSKDNKKEKKENKKERKENNDNKENKKNGENHKDNKEYKINTENNKDNKENKINTENNKENKISKDNKGNKEKKDVIKLEAKINKNREKLFNSQGRILKDESKPEIKLKDNNNDIKNENQKNRQRNNANINSIARENNKMNNSLQEINSIRKPYNFLPNRSKLVNNNSNLSKKKLQEKNQSELKDKNKEGVDSDKEKEKEKVINFKKTIPPATIDIDLELDLSNEYNTINANKTNECMMEKPFLLSSERYSVQNKEPSTYSLSKNNEIKINYWDNSNASETKLLYDESKKMNNFAKYNKSPSIKKKPKANKILRTKTEKKKKNYFLKKSRFNAQKKSTKEIGKIKSTKNQNDDRISLNTIDNESFKKSTVKKLIKNNQYKALLTEITTITTINLNKDDINKDKEKDKDKGNKKIKKKFRFSERRKGSLHNEPLRKLTESSENYYDLYQKAFNNKNEIEQKFSFRPREKKKNYYKYSYNRNKDIEEDNNKILNKKISTMSFNSKQKKVLDNDNILNEFSIPLDKNMLSNSLNEERIYINNENEEQDSNKNFILDLNHYIPIDEDKLINTISKPLFGENNNKGKD